MSREAAAAFHEEQRFRQRRVFILVAIPPAAMLLLVIWQVVLGNPWGNRPMSNASLIGWTIFLWLVYLRLILVRLVTEVRPGELSIALRGLWRKRRIRLEEIKSVAVVTFDAERDYGGYGIRKTRRGMAYLVGGNQGVRLDLAKGAPVILGSQRPQELANVIQAMTHAAAS